MNKPTLSLDDLATDWLPRNLTRLAAMPGLNNDLGAIQIEADAVAVKHPVFPPFSAGGEVTGMTVFNGKVLAQWGADVEVRWRAFEVERRCSFEQWRLSSRTALLPEEPGVLVELTVCNEARVPREMDLSFLLSGRARNTGTEGYAWAVPVVPTDVFSFTKTEGLAQSVRPAGFPDGVLLSNDRGNAHSVQCVWPPADHWGQGRIPSWRRTLSAGESLTVCLLCVFGTDADLTQEIARRWHGQAEEIFQAARQRWETIWQAAFIPDNEVFSGSLPVLDSPHEAMNRLYYNGILTLLTCRRVYPESVLRPCYLTLWPRRGEGSAYLAWELPYTSGILARLDPEVLERALGLLLSAPFLDYQVTNLLNGKHGGWKCCAHPQAVFTAAVNLVRWTGRREWMSQPVTVQPSDPEGFEAASQGQEVKSSQDRAFDTNAGEIYRSAVEAHLRYSLAGTDLVSFGDRAAYLECITTYAYGTAGHTALQARALLDSALLLGENRTAETEKLRQAVHELYASGQGYFFCQYPDGSRVPAANLYDLSLVLLALGECLPSVMVEEIVNFVRKHLLTETWAHCLAPTDLDMLSGIRADHQWAGCFPAWPAQFVIGLLRAGYRESWMVEWLSGLSKITRQGPFGQAYWAEDLYPPEAGAAAKCYDELTQGNHWVIGSGVYFAEMILDGVCGLQFDAQNELEVREGLEPWCTDATISGIRTPTGNYRLERGRLRIVTTPAPLFPES